MLKRRQRRFFSKIETIGQKGGQARRTLSSSFFLKCVFRDLTSKAQVPVVIGNQTRIIGLEKDDGHGTRIPVKKGASCILRR
jgi:hypothetical protein